MILLCCLCATNGSAPRISIPQVFVKEQSLARMTSPQTVHIWRVDLTTKSSFGIDTFLGVLDQRERENAARFVHAKNQLEYVLSHFATRTVLSSVLDREPGEIVFQHNQWGKPKVYHPVSTPMLDFSLSHTTGRAIIGVALGGRIGVDVECMLPPDHMELARRWFTHEESTWLEALPPTKRAVRFLQCWTRKEAYLKSIGKGLSEGLNCLRCTQEADGALTGVVSGGDTDQAAAWHIIPLDEASAAACAVVDFEPKKIAVSSFDWQALSI